MISMPYCAVNAEHLQGGVYQVSSPSSYSFPFPDTLLGHHVQYTLQSKGIDFGSYSGEECQRICGFMLKLVQENREKEDGHVPGVWRVPGTGHQVRILAWESHGQRSLAGLPSYRKEFKTEPQQSKSRFI